MDKQTFEEMSARAISGEGITEPQALRIAECSTEELFDIMGLANRVRGRFHGSRVKLCSIVNARSGRCGEDCAFCAQSARHRTGAPEYALMPRVKVLRAARKALQNGAREFSIVTSGRSLGEKDVSRVAEMLPGIKALGLLTCASLGILSPEALERLARAGLDKYHHNLETSRSHFPAICSTHDYEDRVRTVRAAKHARLKVCSGGIFGLGETGRDRVELASTLRELGVDSIPLNFLNPVAGTRLQKTPLLPALDALRVVMIFRLMLPARDVVICGGRDVTLRDLQAFLIPAGASGLMVGDYLTTSGRDPKLDMQMIGDLELNAATDVDGG